MNENFKKDIIASIKKVESVSDLNNIVAVWGLQLEEYKEDNVKGNFDSSIEQDEFMISVALAEISRRQKVLYRL